MTLKEYKEQKLKEFAEKYIEPSALGNNEGVKLISFLDKAIEGAYQEGYDAGFEKGWDDYRIEFGES